MVAINTGCQDQVLKFCLGISGQDVIDFTGRDFGRATALRRNVDPNGLIVARSHEHHRIHKHRAGIATHNALLNLCAGNALEGETRRAYVSKNLNGISVHRIGFVAYLQKR